MKKTLAISSWIQSMYSKQNASWSGEHVLWWWHPHMSPAVLPLRPHCCCCVSTGLTISDRYCYYNVIPKFNFHRNNKMMVPIRTRFIAQSSIIMLFCHIVYLSCSRDLDCAGNNIAVLIVFLINFAALSWVNVSWCLEVPSQKYNKLVFK